MAALQARLVLVAVEQLAERELAAVGDEWEHAVGAGLAEDLVLAELPLELDPGLLLATVAGVGGGAARAILAEGADRGREQGDLEEGRAVELIEDAGDRGLCLLGSAEARLGAGHALAELVQPLAGAGDAL